MPAPERMPTAPTSPAPGAARLQVSPRTRRIILVGFAIGLALGLVAFLLLWMDQRNDSEFFRPEANLPQRPGQVFEPLPAPMPGQDGRSASGLTEAAEELARNPPPAPQPATPEHTADPSGISATAPPAEAGPLADAPLSRPEPLRRTPPEYPTAALRRRETGTVLVHAEVDAAGNPTDVSVARSSRSRALDRAAVQAVRRWTFRPAQQDGRPVAGSLDVPVEFTLE